jgi:alkanesulfonate monooxygenase SsuD/methylene tetrahydromethanopterin reductase-like flavin-dependent oxidoreductase (luciferase family)
MRLGYFTQPVHPPAKDYRQVLREDREAVLLADQLGYAEAFLGEHITDRAEPITSNLMFIASLCHDARNITFGSAAVTLPSYHPAMVAGHVAMIDHLTDGRFIFGIGPGGLLSDAEAFENMDIDRNHKMLQSIDMILAIWAGKPPYNLKNDYWTTSTERTLNEDIGQGIISTPLQKPHPPIVVTSITPHSRGITAAAARGWDPITSNYVQGHWVATHLPKYLEGLEQGGRPVNGSGWRVAKSIFVADDHAAALRYAKSADGPYGFYFRNIMTKLVGNGRPELFRAWPDQPDDQVTLEQSLDTQVIAGDVNSVVDQILAFREEIGEFGTLLYTGHDWMDPQADRRSMELMASEVMPRVNEALGEPAVAE